MTVLSAQSIYARCSQGQSLTRLYPKTQHDILVIEPFVRVAKQYKGKSYGLTGAGYDIRLGKIRHPKGAIVESYWLPCDGKLVLASALEYFAIPADLQVQVKDKSSWARQGLAVQNTVIEPGWKGYLTLELTNHGHHAIELCAGMPIAQLVFYQLDRPTDRPYTGKYQDQANEPTEAIYNTTPDEDGDDNG